MNQRDLELLSSYLDGQLAQSDSARLETRLRSERELVATLDDLRAARTLLRKLPKRRAPRNFTLTRKMVGLNPPLPRTYPAFRFATVVATLLFFFSFGVNTLAPQILQAPVFGVGGGGEPDTFSQSAPALESVPATEAPAAPDESSIAAAATEAPLESASGLAPLPTATPPGNDFARVLDTPEAKEGEVGNAEGQDQSQIANDAPRPAPFVPSIWQTVFALIAVVGAIFMAFLRRSAMNRWN